MEIGDAEKVGIESQWHSGGDIAGCLGVRADNFIGTNVEDPESIGRLRLLERSYAQGKVLAKGAEVRLHEIGLGKQAALIRELQSSGMQVILLGDIIRIVIPNALFFEPGTAIIRQDKAEIFATLYDFISRYPPAPIDVVGHSDFTGTEKQQKRFSSQVAHTIAGHLWVNGLQKSRFAVRGAGAEDPVTDSISGNLNSRVEIMFHDTT